jgi:hypothetical protein
MILKSSELSAEAQQVLRDYANWNQDKDPSDSLPEELAGPFKIHLEPLCEAHQNCLWGEFEVPAAWVHEGLPDSIVNHLIVCRVPKSKDYEPEVENL